MCEFVIVVFLFQVWWRWTIQDSMVPTAWAWRVASVTPWACTILAFAKTTRATQKLMRMLHDSRINKNENLNFFLVISCFLLRLSLARYLGQGHAAAAVVAPKRDGAHSSCGRRYALYSLASLCAICRLLCPLAPHTVGGTCDRVPSKQAKQRSAKRRRT
jgi:hypothetical protein